MQINNFNNNSNKSNNISYKAIKITCKDAWHPELLKEVLNNEEIKKASDFLEKRNSNMEMEIINNGTVNDRTYSVDCTFDRRFKPQGENCQILENMTFKDALHKLKNFNSRNFIAFVKKAERTNAEKKKQVHQLYRHHSKTHNNDNKHKLLRFFGL